MILEKDIERFVRNVVIDGIEGRATLEDVIGALCLVVQLAGEGDEEAMHWLVMARSRAAELH